MARAGKPLPELHIPLADLGNLSASDPLAIDGPKFITSDSERGARTYAVLISHDKWKQLNHRLPNITPDRAGIFFIGDQAYMVLPVEGSVLIWLFRQIRPGDLRHKIVLQKVLDTARYPVGGLRAWISTVILCSLGTLLLIWWLL